MQRLVQLGMCNVTDSESDTFLTSEICRNLKTDCVRFEISAERCVGFGETFSTHV